jgi:ribonuclease HI
MGTEVGLLGGYGFQGVTLGVRAKMERWGPGAANSGRRSGQMCASLQRGGRHSNRPELGGVVLALQSAALSEDVLLLCDNEALLCAITKWVGQGGKATLATATDADILREIVCLLMQRVRAGRATFLIKVKSHRGEPINERADTLAEEGQEISDGYKRCVCVFITAGPSTKLFAWGGGGYLGTCATRDDEPRPVWTSLLITH